MASIRAVDSHVDDGTHMMAVAPLGAYSVHQPGVADGHLLTAYTRTDTLTGNLFDVGNDAAVGSLVGKASRKAAAMGCVEKCSTWAARCSS